MDRYEAVSLYATDPENVHLRKELNRNNMPSSYLFYGDPKKLLDV